jgi:hypothetical protein
MGLLLPPDTDVRQHDGHREWVGHVNKQGLREDAEIPPEKAPGTWRALALGDSWMFGWSADQGWSLPSQLEVLLPEKLGVERVEVINAGVFGGCAFDMLRRWRKYSASHELDAVLLGTPHNMSRQLNLQERRSDWYRKVRDAPFVDLRLYLVLRRLLAPYTRPQYPLFESQEAAESSASDLRLILADAEAMGLDSWFVLMPTRMEDATFQRQSAARGWVEALGDTGVGFAGHVLRQRSCWGDEDLQHPSAAGYRAIAEVVADAIAAGEGQPTLLSEPSCDDVPGYGPGKE